MKRETYLVVILYRYGMARVTSYEAKDSNDAVEQFLDDTSPSSRRELKEVRIAPLRALPLVEVKP